MHSKHFKISLLLISAVILTLGLSISFQSLLAAWTSPLANPVTCNTGDPGCDEPLNKGSFLQIKSGPLYVNSDQIAATGFAAYGNVGIGTVAPSTNLDVNGSIKSTNLTIFDTTPNVNYGIYGNKSFTDAAHGTMMQYLWAKPTYTGVETVTENFATSQFLNYPIINTGHNNSGIMYGLVTQVLRNINGASADDNGTLANLRGSYIGYGHYNSNTSATPQTTNAYGLYINPYQRTGTINNIFDLYIASPVTGGDVTNQYGIYQQSASRINYFAGDLGVGTIVPSAKLDVRDSSGVGVQTSLLNLSDTGAGINNGAAINFSYASGNILNAKIGALSVTGGGGALTFSVAASDGAIASEHMRITKDGKVGIGTASPSYKLSVISDGSVINGEHFITQAVANASGSGIYLGYIANGSSITSGLVRSDNSLPLTLGTSATNQAVTILNNGNVGVGTTNPVSKLDLGTNYSDPSTYPNKITLWSGGANNYFGFGVSSGDLDYFAQGNHRFYTGYNGSAGTEKMVLTSAGNVGIGTTNPTYKLSINSANSTDNLFQISTTTN